MRRHKAAKIKDRDSIPASPGEVLSLPARVFGIILSKENPQMAEYFGQLRVSIK
jgi:hypothetical protein